MYDFDTCYVNLSSWFMSLFRDWFLVYAALEAKATLRVI